MPPPAPVPALLPSLAAGAVRREHAYAITSAPPSLADAATLPLLGRGHWAVEHRLHGVRDVLFDEERSGATVGGVPRMPAAPRNAAIGLLRAPRDPPLPRPGYTMKKPCRNVRRRRSTIAAPPIPAPQPDRW